MGIASRSAFLPLSSRLINHFGFGSRIRSAWQARPANSSNPFFLVGRSRTPSKRATERASEKKAMAVHDDSNESEKKYGDDSPIFNAENLQSNMKSVYYSRTFLSIVGGVVAGIWGFTGLAGFVFYFVVMAISSLAFAAKAKFSVHTYFDSWNRIVADGLLGGLMSFVLFWTFAYDIVHIF